MEKTKRKRAKFDPGDPEFIERILARIDAMTPEELWELLKRRPEGVDVTNMNVALAEFDRMMREEAEIVYGEKALYIRPNDPEVTKRVTARIQAMTPEEYWERFQCRFVGDEATNRSEERAKVG